MAVDGEEVGLPALPAADKEKMQQAQSVEEPIADGKAGKDESYGASELEKQALEELKRALLAAVRAGEFSEAGSCSIEKKEKSKEEGNTAGDDDNREKEESAWNVSDATEEESLSLWGVPLLDGSGMADVVLLKFLRARELKVDQALKMLKATIEWRRFFGCDQGLLDEKFDSAINSTGFYYGADKDGHPVCYNVIDAGTYQEFLDGQDGVDKLLRWRVQLIEKGIKLLDFNPHGVSSMLQVVDLKNFSSSRKARAVLFNTTQLLSDNYPELVSKMMLVNVPWYFNALYVMISPFLTQRMKNKISVASKGRTAEALFRVISPESIPPQYGGLGKQNEELFRNVKAPVTESNVKAGSMLIIEIQVNEGDEVTWELSVPGWDINYGAEFNPSIEGGYTIVVEKTRKISFGEETTPGICNSFKTNSAGSLLLTIDNSASKKRKQVVYRYFVKG